MTEIAQIRAAALPMEQLSDLDPLLDRSQNARLVLIGEASHGTHEFYDWRAALSKRLIAECGFTDLAIEADQPNCEPIDQCVRLVDGVPDDPGEVLQEQRQWPSWMLANAETAEFCRWLREYNQGQMAENRVRLHGLDGHPLWGATRAVLDYLSNELGWSPDMVNDALDAPLRGESMVSPELIGTVAMHLADVIPTRSTTADAETYYRTLITGGIETMRARSRHWLGRLGLMLDQQGEQSRIVVWAHNTHIGDARGVNESAVSIGRLARERFGRDDVVLIGMAGGKGAVMAAHERGAPMDTIPVPSPRPESVEALFSEALGDNGSALFAFPDRRDTGWLTAQRDHRAIGVVYDPSKEVYVPTRLGQRYDAMLWFAETTPVQALHLEEARHGTLETLRVPSNK